MRNCSTETVVNELILAVYGEQADARKRHVLRQALHGLVRQAKMEQLQEMRRDLWRATGLAQFALDGSGDFAAVPQNPHDGGSHGG
jgi:uncharacterized membrane protein